MQPAGADDAGRRVDVTAWGAGEATAAVASARSTVLYFMLLMLVAQ